MLIVGFDPGKTFGLALIDVEGKIRLVYSDKNKGIDFVIRKIIQFGKPLCIAYDKRIINKSVQEISRKLKIFIILPKEDLKRKKKKEMIREFFRDKKIKIKNKHEFDALASAIFGYKKIRKYLEQKTSLSKLKNQFYPIKK
jgi:predicted RNase H-like nuclease (RuvC/YqgF family)